MPDRDRIETLPEGTTDKLADITKQKQMTLLADLILYHDHMYWVMNNPEISDPEYDELCQKLRVLDPDHPVLHQVHAAVVSKGATIERDKPMLSLDKAYEAPEVFAWAQGVARDDTERFRVSPKYDGLACEIDGDILATSGDDGITGEDISDKLVIIDLGNVRQGYGELVVLKSEYKSLRRSNGEPYKTPRAAAVGLINADKTDRSVGRVIKFMPHDHTLFEFELQDFDTIDWPSVMSDEQNKAQYPADGIVIALVDTEYGESLGATDHHPHHSIAWKFKNPSANTKLIGIEWQCGKHKLTPVAILEPVEISGCSHERASLHNWDQVRRLGITAGCDVEIQRCGDVIPQLTKALNVVVQKSVAVGISTAHALMHPPHHCPGCGAATIYEAPDIKCINPHCGGTAAKRLHDALVRLDIETVGPTIATQLVNAGFVDIPAVFNMEIGDWRNLDGFAAPSAHMMFKRFQKRKLRPIEDYRILAAMNIQGVGVSMAKKICAEYHLNELSEADLESMDGIGPARAAALKDQFDFGLFSWAMVNMDVVQTKGLAERPLVCFTGKSDKSRAEWIKIAEEKGYTFKNAVTKKLALLVCGDLSSTSSKMVKAKKYGTKIMTYTEFEQGE